jgi:hypothetical protein
MSASATFLSRFDAMNRALVGAGFPALSPWWREQIERFVRARRRRWVIRVGRRGGKSSTLCRLAVAWALWGSWSVPPGDTAVVPFVFIDRDEAAARLRTIAAILRVLDVPFDERGDELEATYKGRTVLFRVVTCSARGTVGFTSIACFGDEVARWEARDTAANPAREVIASLSPTMATQPHGFMVLSSSPWSTDDFHAEAFDAGDTEHQTTSYAPTWVAHPAITEAETHSLEPDERIWQREYAAVPGETVSAAFEAEDVGNCYGRQPDGELAFGFVAIDASSLRGDAFTWAAGHTTTLDEVLVEEIGGWSGPELRSVSMADIVRDIAAKAKTYGVRAVYGDQREEAALRALFQQRGVQLRSYAWSEPSKDDAVMLLRRTMREQKLLLPDHFELRRELTSLKARLMPSGRTKYETNGLDYASALVTLAHAIVAKDLRLDSKASRAYSKMRERRRRLTAGRRASSLGFMGPPDPNRFRQKKDEDLY